MRIVTCLLSLASIASAGVMVDSGRVTVRFDERLHRTLVWQGARGGTILAFDPAAQEGLVVSGTECTVFREAPNVHRQTEDPEFGPATELTVRGTFEDGRHELRIERETRVLLPHRFPDVALFQTTYRNTSGRTVHVDRVYSQRLLLDRQLAELEEAPYAFASFQGGAYKWGDEYAVIRLRPGFRQSNFQGVDDVKGPEGVGGGMPVVDVWSPTMGVAVAHLEKQPEWVSLPVEVRADNRVEVSLTETPLARFGQNEWLKNGQSYRTVLTAVIFHRLDFHDALRNYSRLLRARGIAIPETSPASAYQPYWKSWGWQRDFTLDMFFAKLPELDAIGIKMANMDDGWQNNVGDWEPNPAPGKFPKGDADMVRFVAAVHEKGFRTGLWWYPLGVSKESRLAKEHPELLVQDETGGHPLDPSDLYQLCPAYQPALDRIREVVVRAVKDWGYDGLYSDFQGLSAVPPCFNPAHGHKSPLDSFRATPKAFELVAKTLHELKKDPYNEVCICSLPHSPYAMPFFDIANASDPLTPWQVRSRVKVEKAMRGGTFAVGDCYQVPMTEWKGSSVPESFESAMGTGAQLTTFYANLDEHQREVWTKWFHQYNEMGLGQAEYVNLYDLAFDKPEVHAVRKGRDMYYGIFAENWPVTRPIELRGLDKARKYEVYDYAHGRKLGTISGSDPVLRAGFKESLLVRVRPLD